MLLNPHPTLSLGKGEADSFAMESQNQSAETTHTLEGDRPEKRLSYMGATCVAGQRNVPAAVAGEPACELR